MPYATLTDVRALPGMDDVAAYPDAVISEGIDYAVSVVEGFTGAAWEPAPFEVRVPGAGWRSIFVPVLGLRTLTEAVAEDGTVLDVTAWKVDTLDNVVTPDPALWGRVTLRGTASVTETVPVDIAWAVRTLARQYVLDLNSRVPDRALSVQSDYGQVMLAQAGGPGRPTSLPDVNAVLTRHRHRPPTLG